MINILPAIMNPLAGYRSSLTTVREFGDPNDNRDSSNNESDQYNEVHSVPDSLAD